MTYLLLAAKFLGWWFGLSVVTTALWAVARRVGLIGFADFAYGAHQ